MKDELIKLLLVILTSSVVAAIVSGTFSILKTNIEYRNEYYKRMLNKRFEAYELIQEILRFFSSAVYDKADNKFYHIIFSEEKNEMQNKFYMNITMLSKANIWISNEICDELNKLNRFFVEKGININSIEDGKKYYIEIGNLRNNLLNVTKKDLYNLHKVKNIQNKKISTNVEKIIVGNNYK